MTATLEQGVNGLSRAWPAPTILPAYIRIYLRSFADNLFIQFCIKCARHSR